MPGITGEGAQCDDLAEGNELIKSLQAKSALSKDRYFQETLDTYNQHNFKGEGYYRCVVDTAESPCLSFE